ncbi:hypothetical protein ACFLUR_03340 [Chloroflexota bacterium]
MAYTLLIRAAMLVSLEIQIQVIACYWLTAGWLSDSLRGVLEDV